MGDKKDTSATENRREKRWELVKSLRVLEQKTDRFVGYLLNITTKGMMLTSANPIPVQKNFHLWIELLSEKIMIQAQSRWSQKDEGTYVYKTGFLFINPDPKTATHIQYLIEALKTVADIN